MKSYMLLLQIDHSDDASMNQTLIENDVANKFLILGMRSVYIASLSLKYRSSLHRQKAP